MSRIGSREPVRPELAGVRSVSDVLWLANTRHGPGGHWFARVTQDDGDHDHLATAADAVRYLVDHHVAVPSVPPGAADLGALVAVREMVRGLLDSSAGWTPDALTILASSRFRLEGDGRVRSAGRGWSRFVGDLMLPLVELIRNRDRLAMCGNPVCRLVFLDGSRSGTRRWCDDAGCGNRDRVKRHRRKAS
jgi:predicted RNA-binding Zn ribbon-like protein